MWVIMRSFSWNCGSFMTPGEEQRSMGHRWSSCGRKMYGVVTTSDAKLSTGVPANEGEMVNP